MKLRSAAWASDTILELAEIGDVVVRSNDILLVGAEYVLVQMPSELGQVTVLRAFSGLAVDHECGTPVVIAGRVAQR